jgi:hypothetical protein
VTAAGIVVCGGLAPGSIGSPSARSIVARLPIGAPSSGMPKWEPKSPKTLVISDAALPALSIAAM